VVNGLITVFGVTTAPLVLCLALDAVVGLLVVRSCMETPAASSVALAASDYPEGSG
jgi:hypothetical protein